MRDAPTLFCEPFTQVAGTNRKFKEKNHEKETRLSGSGRKYPDRRCLNPWITNGRDGHTAKSSLLPAGLYLQLGICRLGVAGLSWPPNAFHRIGSRFGGSSLTDVAGHRHVSP